MKNTVYASCLVRGFNNNSFFDLAHKLNRDNCVYPYYAMRQMFKTHGIELNTYDVNGGNQIIFELHVDVHSRSKFNPRYLLMLETPQVCLSNSVRSNFDCYRKVFTWNDELVDGDRFIKINFPNPIQIYPANGFSIRDKFCCLIASNRALAVQDDRILYPERIKDIRWFEKNAPQDFDLYGVDWNMPVLKGNILGKILRRLWRFIGFFINFKPFPSYRGKVVYKREVLARAKFAICYENVRDLPGYITEKIFDCFFSGCIPVYWGASNIEDYIPPDTFIDRRHFKDTEGVYRFLKSITEVEYSGYQERIAEFLKSDKVYPFSSEFFAETIVKTVVQDLGDKP